MKEDRSFADYVREKLYNRIYKCCLVFDMTITSKFADKYYTACFLNREPSDITFYVRAEFDTMKISGSCAIAGWQRGMNRLIQGLSIAMG